MSIIEIEKLIKAIKTKRYKIVKEFLKKIKPEDLDIDYSNCPEENCPTYIAIKERSNDILALLLEFCPKLADKIDNHGNRPIHYAVAQGSAKSVKEIYKYYKNFAVKNNCDITPLYLAVSKLELKVVELLFELDSSLKSDANMSGLTLYKVIQNNDIEMIELLVKNNSGFPNLISVGKTKYIEIAYNLSCFEIIELMKSSLKYSEENNFYNSSSALIEGQTEHSTGQLENYTSGLTGDDQQTCLNYID